MYNLPHMIIQTILGTRFVFPPPIFVPVLQFIHEFCSTSEIYIYKQ